MSFIRGSTVYTTIELTFGEFSGDCVGDVRGGEGLGEGRGEELGVGIRLWFLASLLTASLSCSHNIIIYYVGGVYIVYRTTKNVRDKILA